MVNASNDQNKDIALLLLRLGVGIIFIVAGWGKITGIEGTQGFFGEIGIPLPGLMAWIVAIVEFVGGILVLVGAYIRIPAILLAIIMVVALLTTKVIPGESFSAYRLDLMLLLASAALALMGSGKFSLDDKLGSK
ncbi:DoxX family protein [Natronogracilivirga saccharolytica]|uniref:DoxX family protein n=1 Tax=Natronogracilivirga saccharolytica TaxID=2812953 RepID=A0A8J7S9Y7_9BACT|nr:DoxX family protein [Natronogracilivirga saccharolytica]MBP3192761.1 DoxX family protein [Natronogracilivirga saccharolytica]